MDFVADNGLASAGWARGGESIGATCCLLRYTLQRIGRCCVTATGEVPKSLSNERNKSGQIPRRTFTRCEGFHERPYSNDQKPLERARMPIPVFYLGGVLYALHFLRTG